MLVQALLFEYLRRTCGLCPEADCLLLASGALSLAPRNHPRGRFVLTLLASGTQEDDLNTLHLIVSFLLFDGRQNEISFQMMNDEGSFPRLVELIQLPKKDENIDPGLHRLLMDLFYEMSRIQRVKVEDLGELHILVRTLGM